MAYLLKTLGPDLLLEVLEQPSVSASFLRSQPATTRTAAGGLVTYNFVEVEFHAPKSPNVPKSGIVKRASDAEWIELMVKRSLGASRTTRRFTKKLIKKLSPATWKDNAVGSKSLTVLGREDLNDLDFVQQAVGRVVSTLVPSFVLPNDWHFRPMLIGDQIAIDTNFDFAALNQEYH